MSAATRSRTQRWVALCMAISARTRTRPFEAQDEFVERVRKTARRVEQDRKRTARRRVRHARRTNRSR